MCRGFNLKGGSYMEFVFDMEENAEKIEEFKAFIETQKDVDGALMGVLQKGQELFGYLPIEVQEIASAGLKVPLAEIYGVVTFYSQFSIVPKGEHSVGVCMGTACYVRGAGDVMEEVEAELGITGGQTTPDLKFSIAETRCVGACGLAPVVMIDEDIYAHVSTDQIPEILEKYRD